MFAGLRVRLFVGLEVEGLTARSIGSRKARTMVKVLALARGAPVGADHLVEVLWPDAGAAPARPAEQAALAE